MPCFALASHEMKKIKENICKIPKEAFYARTRATSSRDLISFQVACCHSNSLHHKRLQLINVTGCTPAEITFSNETWSCASTLARVGPNMPAGNKVFLFFLLIYIYCFCFSFSPSFFNFHNNFTLFEQDSFYFWYAEEAAVKQAAELSCALLNFSWCAQYRGTNP